MTSTQATPAASGTATPAAPGPAAPGPAAPASARTDRPAGAGRTPRAARAARRPRVGALLLALPVPALVLVLWTVGVDQAWELPFGIRMGFLPTPLEVGRRLVDLAAGGIVDDAFSGTLVAHLWASTQRVLAGFALAVALAVPLGVVMGRFSLAFRMLEPTVNLARPIPVTAWAPLTLLIIGYGDGSAIFLVFLAAFFPVLLNTIAGVRQVPVRLLEAAAMLGTRKAQVLYKVVLPASMRSIASGLRVALGLSWVILVVGETVGISTGLGAMITQARDQSKTDLIVAGMVVIGLCGFVADRLLTGLLALATRGRPTLT